jgi:hypothetical protein
MCTAEIITRIIFISLFCNGLKILTWDGMLLHKPYSFIDDLVQNEKIRYILKPIIFCVVCYASFWGGIMYYSLYGIDKYIIFVLVGSVYLNYLLNRILAEKL